MRSRWPVAAALSLLTALLLPATNAFAQDTAVPAAPAVPPAPAAPAVPSAPAVPASPAAPAPVPAPPAPPAMPTPPTPAPPPAVVAPPAPQQPLPPGTISLLYKFQVGQVISYSLTSTTKGNVLLPNQSMALDQTMTATLKQTVKSIDSSGNATVETTMDDMHMAMSMNGQAMPMPDTVTAPMKAGYTLVISPVGKVISMKSNSPAAAATAPGIDTNGFAQAGQMGGFAFLPDHPVKVDDVWRGSIDLSQFGMKLFLKMALTGIDTSNGGNTAKIATKYYMPISLGGGTPGKPSVKGLLSGPGETEFDIAAGILDSADSTLNLDMSVTPPARAANGPISIQIHLAVGTQLTLQTNRLQAAQPTP